MIDGPATSPPHHPRSFIDAMPAAARASFAPADPAAGRRHRRLSGLLVALAATAVLLLASWLDPDPAGLGTHQQLNLPSCGWIATMDLPCPTCGMTTAFANATEGSLLTSFATQPLGFLLALLTAMAAVGGFAVALTGWRAGPLLRRLWGRHTFWMILALVILSWSYKIAAYKGLL